MERTSISEKVSFSKIIQGFWRLKSWEFSADELCKFMKERVELGVTTFDTAEIYGATECETQLGEALKKDESLRNKIEIVTKTGITKEEVNGKMFGFYDTRYQRIIDSCKSSLQRMHTDHADLYLIHREDPCFDPYETGEALVQLKKEGLVLEIGASNFDPFKFEALNRATGNQLVTNQIEWNPLCFEHFDSGMMDYLAMNKLHPMIWSPLAGGLIFKGDDERCKNVNAKLTEIAKRHDCDIEQIVYAYIMYHPTKPMPIVGSSKLERIKKAVEACNIQLEHREWYEIFTASGQKKLR